MANEILTPKQSLKVIRVIYLAMIAGILAYLCVVFLIMTGKLLFKTDFSDPLFTMLFLLSITVVPLGYFISRKRFNSIGREEPLVKKLPVYQSGLIIRLACCEGVALFAVVYLLLSGNAFSLVFCAFALGVMAKNYPTPERIGQEMNLTTSEIDSFN